MVAVPGNEELTSDVIAEAVAHWETSRLQVAEAKRRLKRAEDDLANDEASLGRKLIPAGARIGEEFHIWVRRTPKEERLLAVHVYAAPTSLDGRGVEVEWYRSGEAFRVAKT